MLMASEAAKRGFKKGLKSKDITEMLVREFTEEELQTVFSDLRYFFPEDEIYQKLSLFHKLDIFKGEHFAIRETFKRQ